MEKKNTSIRERKRGRNQKKKNIKKEDERSVGEETNSKSVNDEIGPSMLNFKQTANLSQNTNPLA